MGERAYRTEDDASPTITAGARVWLNGREATFLYARRGGAVVRYCGERQSRVVLLRKLERSPAD